MSRYETMFAALKGKGEGAFVPFVTLGDPNIEASERIVRALLDTGADALELGLPFSDPVADGPTIQAANIRALAAGAGLSAGLNLIRRVREDYPDVPVGLLVYANLPESFGLPEFYGGVAAVGVDSVLVADVPLREGPLCGGGAGGGRATTLYRSAGRLARASGRNRAGVAGVRVPAGPRRSHRH
ncbi:tryptophan synthase subunit alpha [Deinococcus radiophilus]|uniref:tryptophan synthase subunit alpha n=1 Tax=Deinococcus radiophilus TaxID=32062 RepID=UPI003605C411